MDALRRKVLIIIWDRGRRVRVNVGEEERRKEGVGKKLENLFHCTFTPTLISFISLSSMCKCSRSVPPLLLVRVKWIFHFLLSS